MLPMRIARDKRVKLSDARPAPLHLRPLDMRRVAAIPFVAGEGAPAKQRARLRELASTPDPGCTLPDPDDLEEHAPEELLEIRKLTNDHMTEEEKNLKSFSRKNLMKLPNWVEWLAADRKH